MDQSSRTKAMALLLGAAGMVTTAWIAVPHGGDAQPQAKHHHSITHHKDNDRSGAEAGESPRRDKL